MFNCLTPVAGRRPRSQEDTLRSCNFFIGHVQRLPGRFAVYGIEEVFSIKSFRDHIRMGGFKLSLIEFQVGFAAGIVAAPKPYVIRSFHVTVHRSAAFGTWGSVSEVNVFRVGDKLTITKEADVSLFAAGCQPVLVNRIRAAFWTMDIHQQSVVAVGLQLLFHQNSDLVSKC